MDASSISTDVSFCVASFFSEVTLRRCSRTPRSSCPSMIWLREKIRVSSGAMSRARWSSSVVTVKSRSRPLTFDVPSVRAFSNLLDADALSARESSASFSMSAGSKDSTTSPAATGPAARSHETRIAFVRPCGTEIGVLRRASTMPVARISLRSIPFSTVCSTASLPRAAREAASPAITRTAVPKTAATRRFMPSPRAPSAQRRRLRSAPKRPRRSRGRCDRVSPEPR